MSEYMDELLQEKESFAITDDQKAMWAIRKIKEAEADAKTLLDHYEEQTRKVAESLMHTREYFETLLADYFAAVPHRATKTQESYALPGATLVKKYPGPTFTRDDNTFLAFLKASGRDDCIKTIPATEKPAWDKYKPLTTVVDGVLVEKETGEVVQGVTVTQNPAKFEVKIEEA